MAEEALVKQFRELTWTDVANDELALVARCVAGEEDACAELVAAHQRMVYQLALNLMGDHHDALDVSQDVFLKVFRTLPRFRGQSSLRTWIYRIVVNEASNRQRWWRRRRRAQQVSIDVHEVTHGELPSPAREASPESAFSRKETETRVWHALDRLPFEQRSVIVLREIEGLRYEEIAWSLGLASGTVKSRLARAREQLRGLLGDA